MHSKSFDFVTKQFDEDDDKFVVEGLASTPDVDQIGDIVQPGAFTESIARLKAKASRLGTKALMPMLFNHRSDDPIGVFTELTETEEGLFTKAELPKADVNVSGKIVPQMKAGSIRGMSIGFMIDEQRFEGDLRILEKVSLLEASAVIFPMNREATITSLKSERITKDDLLDMDDVREIERLLRKGVPMSRSLAEAVAPMLRKFQSDPGKSLNQGDLGSSADGADEKVLNERLNQLFTRMGV